MFSRGAEQMLRLLRSMMNKMHCIAVECSSDEALKGSAADSVSSSLTAWFSQVEMKHLSPAAALIGWSRVQSRALDLIFWPVSSGRAVIFLIPKQHSRPLLTHSEGSASAAQRSASSLIVSWGEGHAGDVTALIWALQHFLSALHLFIMRSWSRHCWWTLNGATYTAHRVISDTLSLGGFHYSIIIRSLRSCTHWHRDGGQSEHYPQQIWSLQLKLSSSTTCPNRLCLTFMLITF